MMSKKIVPVLIFGSVFALPWVHRLSYENLMIAVPGMESGPAHVTALAKLRSK